MALNKERDIWDQEFFKMLGDMYDEEDSEELTGVYIAGRQSIVLEAEEYLLRGYSFAHFVNRMKSILAEEMKEQYIHEGDFTTPEGLVDGDDDTP